MKKRVGIVGANGVPASYGGWDQLVEHFTQLETESFEFVIYSTYLTNPNNNSIHNNALVRSIKLDANGWQSIPYDLVSLYRAWRECDLVIMLGTSEAIGIPIFRLLGQRLILNIDGAEWKRGKWGGFVKAFLWLSEYVGVKFAGRVVADNEVLSDYVRGKYGLVPSTIAYGGDHVKSIPAGDLLHQVGVRPGHYAFKVCRIVPENNVEMILEAFVRNGQIPFVLVGNFDSSDFGCRLREDYSNRPNIKLLDPIYDQIKLDELRSNAGLYIHGHSVGGTNPSLVEAMCLGLNVVSFDVDYNRATTGYEAHYFNSVETLGETIVAFAEGKLTNKGQALKDFAYANYSWRNIMNSYLSLLEQL